MAAEVGFKQDLPPKGGYAPINFKRIPAKQVLNAPLIYGGVIASVVIGNFFYKKAVRRIESEKIEMKSADLALTPLMLAERDREFLKQCRRNRDAEAKLMENVEGWEVGTWYGHEVYKTLNGKWMDPSVNEFYIHCSAHEQRKYDSHVQGLKMD